MVVCFRLLCISLWHVFVVILHLVTIQFITLQQRQETVLCIKVLYLQSVIKRHTTECLGMSCKLSSAVSRWVKVSIIQ